MPAELFVVSNPRGAPRHVKMSERDAWNMVRELTTVIKQQTSGNKGVAYLTQHMSTLAARMLHQLDRGVHVNARGAKKMSDHVQCVAYRHLDDDARYCHGFGDADITIRNGRAGRLDVSGLKDTTDVAMYAMPDGSITLRSSAGRCLWDDFDVEDND